MRIIHLGNATLFIGDLTVESSFGCSKEQFLKHLNTEEIPEISDNADAIFEFDGKWYCLPCDYFDNFVNDKANRAGVETWEFCETLNIHKLCGNKVDVYNPDQT